MKPLAARHALPCVLASVALALTGCGSSSSDDSASSSSSSSKAAGPAKIAVVASTNVYGSIAAAVGGRAVAVTSIISDPEQDPHSYEANTKTVLTLSKAKLVIENGGGYDDFVDRMLKARNSDAAVINAVDVSGKKTPPGGALNEHIWYDLESVDKIADQIAEQLGRIDPKQKATFDAGAAAFGDKVAAMVDQEQQMRSTHAGEAIGITEPVPLYMTEAVGLVNKTPGDFSEAIEEGDDVSPKVLDQTLALYRDSKVAALVYNQQTSGPETERVKKAAQQAGVAVVPVTETLPAGTTYLMWMKSNLDALQSALDKQ